MKRKELAQLLRKYRNDEHVSSIEINRIIEDYQLVIWYNNHIMIPSQATAIVLNNPLDLEDALTIFCIKVEPKNK